jgi:hypothetical protein
LFLENKVRAVWGLFVTDSVRFLGANNRFSKLSMLGVLLEPSPNFIDLFPQSNGIGNIQIRFISHIESVPEPTSGVLGFDVHDAQDLDFPPGRESHVSRRSLGWCGSAGQQGDAEDS